MLRLLRRSPRLEHLQGRGHGWRVVGAPARMRPPPCEPRLNSVAGQKLLASEPSFTYHRPLIC